MPLNILAWQTRVKPTLIKKQRGKITLPAFNVVDYADNCYAMTNGKWEGDTTAIILPANGLTVEAWIYVGPGSISAAVNPIVYVFTNYRLSLNDNLTINAYISNQASTPYTVDSAAKINRNAWNHIAMTWDSTDDLIRIYINGVLDANTIATTGTLFQTAGQPFRILPFASLGTQIRVNEVRIWDVQRSATQIARYMYSPRDTVGTIDGDLIGYWPMDEGAGITIDNRITANPLTLTLTNNGAASENAWITNDSYPRQYGSNWVVAQFAVTVDQITTLKMPLRLPSDCNFALCAKVVTGVGTLNRYILANPTNIALPQNAMTYTGQRLPLAFILEIWHLDGAPTTLLSANVDLLTSNLRVVTTTDYGTLNADDVITIDTNIYATFPWTFPITFNQAK